MTANKKAAISPVLAVGFEKFFYGQTQNYAELRRQAEMIRWNSLTLHIKMIELFSPVELASQVFFKIFKPL